MVKTNVTIGRLNEGYVILYTDDDEYEFYNVNGTLKETLVRFCENNAVSVYRKYQHTSYYMDVEKIKLVLKTLQAEFKKQ